MRRILSALLLTVATLTVCPSLSHAYGIDPAADSVAMARMRARMAKIRKVRPTVALVMSGGGAKGAAHIGVIKYLE